MKVVESDKIMNWAIEEYVNIANELILRMESLR